MIFMIRLWAAGPGVAAAAVVYSIGRMSDTPLAQLHPDQSPFDQRRLPVAGGHELHVAQWGQPEGLPALVLHGGPGSGCSPLLRRFFDPSRYRVVCVDQRGAGLSRPRGATSHNTTEYLLDDLEIVRRDLGLERWLVVGGSWGAALGLAYAAASPRHVSGLLLRAVFLAREQDLGWFFGGAAVGSAELAGEWTRFTDTLGAATSVVQQLHSIFTASDEARQRHTALAWWRWENALASTAGHATDDIPDTETLTRLVDRYRVQSHYLAHRCWLDAPPLLERCSRLPQVPTLLLHGRQDRVCRPEATAELQERLPHARLWWIEGAGHDPTHRAMVDAMVRSLQSFAASGRFDTAERAAASEGAMAQEWRP